MLRTIEADTGIIIAKGTNDSQLARILAGIAQIEEGCMMRAKGDNPALPERVYFISRETIRKIKRNPEPIDAAISVARVFVFNETPYRASWQQTDAYQVIVRGINLEVFEGKDEAVKQAIEAQRPMVSKLWSGLQHSLLTR